MILKHSFIKFLVVGVINTCIGLSVIFICLKLFNLNYWISTFIGNAIGAIVSYFLNKSITFQSDAPLVKSMIRFILVILFCYFISYKLGLSLSKWMFEQWDFLPDSYDHEAAVLLGSGLYTITNYFGQRFVVFNRNPLQRTGS
ncbi:GtrA family protein [Heyndrickxia sp. NPDC080065]|uniref:GtrA family protein n=1 Tax=Heyndrickxia sp. NPDC080065 TaxID=3390568 RepID=UPI003D016DB1